MGEGSNNGIKQYVTFKLGKEEYGVETQKVTSIEKMKVISRVPKTPDFIKGVINMRGEIIPIMDMRIRFGFPITEGTEETRIIILNIEDKSVGVIVDEVNEVLRLTDDSIESISGFESEISQDYITGIGEVNGRIVTLLNFDRLIKI